MGVIMWWSTYDIIVLCLGFLYVHVSSTAKNFSHTKINKKKVL
jgi:hypothetical protein